MRVGCGWLIGAALLAVAPLMAGAETPEHWVGTWGTASFAVRNAGGPAPAGGVPAGVSGPFAASAETLREIVHVSIGGARVRVELSNAYGTGPLLVSAASVGISSGGDGVRPGSLLALAFGGKPNVTIPTGASVLSDPVDLKVEPLADLAISLYLPAQTIATATEHTNGVQANLRLPGDATGQTSLSGGVPFFNYVFLKSVQVVGAANVGSVVAFGDSITDGAHVTRDSNMRWPDELSRRLQADKHTRNLAVLNEGIGGNRVLHDGTGPNALARLGTDVLDQPGVRYLILLEAINDIGRAYQSSGPTDVVTADDLIRGYEQIIEQAHEHGIKVIGATLTPYLGAGYSSPAGEQVRVTVNQWIRGTGHFDGVVDFEAATRDPAHPAMFQPNLECGDHLHPNDAGYKAMGDAIDLGLFQR